MSQILGFAKQSGGGVSIRSRVGEGTSICIYLPRANRAPERLTQDDLAWLAAHRVGSSAVTDAGTLLSRMRDEDER